MERKCVTTTIVSFIEQMTKHPVIVKRHQDGMRGHVINHESQLHPDQLKQWYRMRRQTAATRSERRLLSILVSARVLVRTRNVRGLLIG